MRDKLAVFGIMLLFFGAMCADGESIVIPAMIAVFGGALAAYASRKE